MKTSQTVYAENKRVFHEYEILETIQAGIALLGHEVKAVRNGKISLIGSYAKILHHELYLIGASISPYQPSNISGEYDPQRNRRLLVKRSELRFFMGKLEGKGLTLVPLKVYNYNGLIKLELGLARAKKKYDKREIIRGREVQRKMERIMKEAV